MFAKPTLSRDDVRDALNSIAEARSISESNPLLNFALVRQKATSPEYISGPYAKVCAVSEVFEEVLLGILGEERRIATIANSLEYLKQDFQSGNSFLQGYSLVYYRYLRPQLGIDSEKAAVLVGFAPRTIRRRLNDGTDHLSLDLVRREIELRRVIRISREMDVSRDDLAAAYQVIPASTHRKSNGKNASVRTLLD